MFAKFNIRFQSWVLGATAALVLLLTGIFLLTVFGNFRKMSEENALERFALIARQSVAQIDNQVQDSARFVALQARSGLAPFIVDGHINQRDLILTLISSLEANTTLYSHYFGLPNDEFVQVIGIRGDPHIVAALNAPANAHFGIRIITRNTDGSRSETWQFLAENRRLLSQRTGAAQYAPATRPWFIAAITRDALSIAPPYLFASTGKLGLTISAPLQNKAGVFGTDISLLSLDAFLAQMPLPPNGAILMLDENSRVLAFHGHGEYFSGLVIPPLTDSRQIDNPWLKSLHRTQTDSDSQISALGEADKREMFVMTRHTSATVGGTHFQVVTLAPTRDFSGPIDQARQKVLWVTFGVLLLLVPLALLGSRQVSRSLVALAQDSERIKRLDFSGEPHQPDSFFYEINALGEAQAVMQHSLHQSTEALKLAEEKLAKLVDNGLLLSREKDRKILFKNILFGGRHIAHCAAATLFLKTERNTLAFAMRTQADDLPAGEIPLFQDDGTPNEHFVVTYAALHNETVIIDDVYRETRFDLSGTKAFSEETGFHTVSMLTVPLSPREGEVIGLLQLLNALDPQTGAVIPFPPELTGFIEALAAQSALALENHNLLEAQKNLLDSLIKIIAEAIDTKSAYTGGHCRRVPELAVMLAEEVGKQQDGPLAGAGFKTQDEWHEFRIGAWLHDCGKVTTPEYVVDKATKLETIHNRIHEIRTRFEVLLRDAQIQRLESLAAGMPAAEADATFATRQQQLQNDFAFIAECNQGDEYMIPERIARLQQIGATAWLRHFDDRIGLSEEELMRHANLPAVPLPAIEPLLADKPWHVIARTGDTPHDTKYNFKAKVPEHRYNYGELYNLSVSRGTLTEEERFKINEHIIQTIIMLDNLPLPKHLKRVPEYAGAHHETLNGRGYPRQLTANELSIPSRIMAIADIFEALTASDRPYKKAKTLSESIKILSFLKKDRHIDPDLFDLFLTSGVYRRYGEHFLKPEQIDEVEINQFIG